MKTLMCSLAAVLCLALRSGILAADEDQFTGYKTGTVVYADERRGYIEIDEGKHHERGRFEVLLTGDLHTRKVCEEVRVLYYACGGRRERGYCADEIEKIGKADGGSKKR